jgi:hypothetical protein
MIRMRPAKFSTGPIPRIELARLRKHCLNLQSEIADLNKKNNEAASDSEIESLLKERESKRAEINKIEPGISSLNFIS